ncbi:MAG: peptide/nickel transport system substrate-binding protein [Pseudonocardiales bacterium]|nr:peptide/nickel transport system substrate-binding protein [Pseudonocardiales bacterium]
MKSKLLATAVAMVGVVAALMMTGCSSSKSPDDSRSGSVPGVAGRPVTARIVGDWLTMNPYDTAGNINSIVLYSGIYDRLVGLSGDAKSAVPYLATKWDITPTKLTFTIRSGVTCSDGTALDAAAIAKSVQFLTTQPEAKLLLGRGPYTVTSNSSASTVTITLGTPFSDALLDLTSPHASIICPSEIAKIQNKDTTSAIGSGAYTITEAVHNDHVKLAPRSAWTWGPNGESAKRAGFPSALTLQVLTEDSTAANELMTGQLDVASVSGPDVARLIANKKLTHTTFGGQYLSNLVFNPRLPVLANDLKLRQAIAQSIDTKAFMQADTGGYGVTSASIFAPNGACHDDSVASLVPAASIDEAQALMISDGYTLSNGKMVKDGKALSLNLLSTTANFSSAGQEYIAAQLGELGITVKITSVDSASYTSMLVKGTYDIAMQFLSGGGPAPGNYILYLTGPSFANGGGNSSLDDPDVNTLVTKAFGATGADQCPAWAAVQQKVISQRDVLPLDQQTKQFFANGVKMQTLTALTLDSLTR